MTEIRTATTPTELQEVYRFRYRVYVEEMGRAGYYADHQRKMLTDPLDETGVILAAWDEGRIVGTIRGNSAAQSDLGYNVALCQMKQAGHFYPRHTSLTTKLMIDKAYRQSTLPIRMVIANYRLGRKNGVEFNFHSCPEQTIPLYNRLGFRQLQADAENPEYGSTTTMILCLSDVDYFRQIKSPLWREAKKYPVNHNAVNYYYQHFH
ncbi:MAG: GNAT family N-acyltransferase [Chloroflexota bacterium]